MLDISNNMTFTRRYHEGHQGTKTPRQLVKQLHRVSTSNGPIWLCRWWYHKVYWDNIYNFTEECAKMFKWKNDKSSFFNY